MNFRMYFKLLLRHLNNIITVYCTNLFMHVSVVLFCLIAQNTCTGESVDDHI